MDIETAVGIGIAMLSLGAAVVGWVVNTTVRHGERIAALEARKCICGHEEGESV